jgi:hypothetical protein
LRRGAKYLARTYLYPMVEEGALERTIPDDPDHPFQAYRTSSKDESAS